MANLPTISLDHVRGGIFKEAHQEGKKLGKSAGLYSATLFGGLGLMAGGAGGLATGLATGVGMGALGYALASGDNLYRQYRNQRRR